MWQTAIDAHIKTAEKMRLNKAFEAQLEQTAFAICKAIRRGGKILLFGNGGSAADAQHIAAEFVGRFYLERPAINAVALTTNTSILTAIANDYDFSSVFSRQISSFATEQDIVIGISTSGSAKSVLAGLQEAKRIGACTILLTGKNGKEGIADYVIPVPSQDTPRIQEMHILIGHYWAEYVEKALYNDKF